MRRSALALAAIAAAAAAAATPAVQVHDPLLGLRWSEASTHFAAADPALKTRCANLVNDNYDARLVVLARAAGANGELLIVAGPAIPRRADLHVETDTLGALLRRHGADCTLIAPALEPFQDAGDYASDVSAAELAALADDAARRYVTAFGGARALCAAAVKQRVRVAKAPPLLARAFRRAASCLPRG